MNRHATLFRALSDETRLTMLGLLLSHTDLCVCDFVAVLGITQSKASRHLRYLKHAGLLQDRRVGQWVRYGVHPAPDAAARQILALLENLIRSLPSADIQASLATWLDAKTKQAGAACPQPMMGV